MQLARSARLALEGPVLVDLRRVQVDAASGWPALVVGRGLYAETVGDQREQSRHRSHCRHAREMDVGRPARACRFDAGSRRPPTRVCSVDPDVRAASVQLPPAHMSWLRRQPALHPIQVAPSSAAQVSPASQAHCQAHWALAAHLRRCGQYLPPPTHRPVCLTDSVTVSARGRRTVTIWQRPARHAFLCR